MKFISIIFIFVCLTFIGFVETAQARQLTMTILYDNYEFKNGLISANGFSCLIKGTEKTILFDTGGDGDVLLHNMEQLNVSPESVDIVVISHNHGDHTKGLLSFSPLNNNALIYLPGKLLPDINQQISLYNPKIKYASAPFMICKGVYSTGVMGEGIQEQALIINSKRGLIVITGCAHPGIVNIIENAMRLFKKRVLIVFGGFHLKYNSHIKTNNIIDRFISLGVKNVGGSHCTDMRTRQLFQAKYGHNFIQMGVGKTISLK